MVSRHETFPLVALVRDMYEDYKDIFRAYWKIADVNLQCIPYEHLPGTTAKGGLRVPNAFRRSQLSFAYWLTDPSADACTSTPRVDLPPPSSGVQKIARPTVPLHGVDFSGIQETGGRNRKIWIASWYPDRDFVKLKSGGGDPGFDRSKLATMVLDGGGMWVFDFPFGPPAAVAKLARWKDWQEYTAWCGSDSNPTVLRDQLRKELVGVSWSQKRNIDRERGTTWFPFFEQLYRQTITGDRDVLYPLSKAKNSARTRILPFHEHASGDQGDEPGR